MWTEVDRCSNRDYILEMTLPIPVTRLTGKILAIYGRSCPKILYFVAGQYVGRVNSLHPLGRDKVVCGVPWACIGCVCIKGPRHE